MKTIKICNNDEPYKTQVYIHEGPCKDTIENPPITFNFEPDHFQKHSFIALSKDENVLVTAHTGSGKTVVAKYAIAHYLRKKQKIFYTSPIKALSNQKYKELKEDFESENVTVGLMTGDNKICPDANLVIMTTEILRNELYRHINGSDPNSKFLNNVGCVIFDEVHYINDYNRGHVWEETIMMLDQTVTLVMLSATINDPESFAEWIGTIKIKPVHLIPTDFRVVPLEHFIYVNENIYKIMDKNGKYYDKMVDEANKQFTWLLCPNKNPKTPYRRRSKYKRPSHNYILNQTVDYLEKKNMLQAIFFCFSRKKCEKYAKNITHNLLDHNERAQVEKLFHTNMRRYGTQHMKLDQYQLVKELTEKGICYHHSGLIPIFKEFIEILFQKGLVKVLFATETFAVGVNMPTRTIVFTELEKFSNYGKRNVTPAEYKQMSGRAGRRGIDKFGYVIILPLYDFPYNSDLRAIMLGKVPKIESKFYIEYSFILNIISDKNIKSLDHFLNKSLLQRDNDRLLIQEKYELGHIRDVLRIGNFKFSPQEIKEFNAHLEYKSIKNNCIFKFEEKKKKSRNNYNFESKLEKYKEYLKVVNNLKYKEEYINFLSTHSKKECEKMINFMYQFKYLSKNTFPISKNDVTIKGLMASQIHECNPILLTELIYQRILNGLTSSEIAAILAIFIQDVKSNEIITINSVKCSEHVVFALHKIKELIDQFIKCEITLGIGLHSYDYWIIYYNHIDVVYCWSSGHDISKVQSIMEIYEGNFIRNILKVYNLVQNIKSLCKMCNNLELIPKMNELDGKLMRDIVNVDSLYI